MSLPRKPFGSVCHLVNGKAFKPTDWSSAGVPIIRIQNLNGADKPFNHWAGALDKQVLVKTGDLLLAWSGTPGTSFGAHIWSGPNGILNQHIFRCDVDQKAVTKEWARIAVNHRLHRLIEQAHGGVGLQHVTRGMVEELEIPLPPLAEQRRIAEVLDRAEALRAERRAALAQLDALTQSLFLDLFGDPVANPKGWTMKSFDEICETRLGKMLDQKQQTGQHVRPYLRNANVQWFRFDLADVFEMDFDDKARGTFRLEVGDLLICEGGEPGRAAVWRGEIAECYYQKALHRARPRNGLAIPEFLAWQFWFLANRGGLGDHVTSATIAHLTGEKLNAMKVPLPPISLQREFARRVTAVEALKTAHRASLAELDALFATLQHRAFRGEL